jgi:ribosomal protein S18 acetylase RimI-like enzyme
MSGDLIRLTKKDLGWGGALLGRAFMEDPLLKYVIPEEERRTRLVPWFVTASLAYGCLYGEAYATPFKDGISFFLPPGQTDMTIGRMFRSGMLAAPFKLGMDGFNRFMKMADFTDKLHKQHASMPHYYLFGMGIEPSGQGKGVGSRLMGPVLERSDADGVPCYLETQNSRNVPFYHKHGFVVVVEAEMPDGGLQNWGMLRQPAASSSSRS